MLSLLFVLILVFVIAMGVGTALYRESGRQPIGAAGRQIADLMARVDELERSAVAAANEIRRLDDAQRFTERLLTSRSGAPDESDTRAQ